MKRMLFVLSLVVPGVASAQTLGCFVETNGTLECSNRTISCGASQSLNHISFGTTVGNLCDQVLAEHIRFGEMADTAQNCINEYGKLGADYKNLHAHWSACGDTTKQIYGAIGYWEGLAIYWQQQTAAAQQAAAAQASLAARLRAKCGRGCRSIQ